MSLKADDHLALWSAAGLAGSRYIFFLLVIVSLRRPNRGPWLRHSQLLCSIVTEHPCPAMESDSLASQLYNKPEHRHILVGNWQEEQKLLETTGSHRYKVCYQSLWARHASETSELADNLSACSHGLTKTRVPPSMPQGKTSQSSCPLLKGCSPMMKGWYTPLDKLYM